MTNFNLNCVGTWRDGEVPKDRGATHVVNYDQKNHAYKIQPDEYDDFELPKLAQMIDNTRRHYHDDFVWRIDDMLARSRG